MNKVMFFQLISFFILFILSIAFFQILGLDVNFIVTFILAIFSLAISIFFFIESTRFFIKFGDKLTIIEENLKLDKRKVKNLNISDSIKMYNKLRNTKK